MGKVALSYVSSYLRKARNVGVDIQASMLTQATVTKCLRQGKVKQQESVVNSSEF